MLLVDNLHTGYTAAAVVRGASLRVGAGSIVSILGPNGAGKTALMRAISALNPVSAGRIEFLGMDLRGKPPEEVVGMGMIHVPQGRALFGAMTVQENLAMGAYLVRDRQERERRLAAVLDMFPILRERHWQEAAYLSGGEQQMLAIGRALMSQPRLLLLDEPSLGLAPKVFDEILEKVQAIHASGASILIAEQSARKVLRIADYCYVLEGGAIALQGPAEVLAKDRRVEQSYLGMTH